VISTFVISAIHEKFGLLRADSDQTKLGECSSDVALKVPNFGLVQIGFILTPGAQYCHFGPFSIYHDGELEILN
jgi:hypothetical protein